MASKAIAATQAGDWRAAFTQSIWRSGELIVAFALFALMIMLGLALASYSQIDASVSTAAGGEINNWMGAPGAWLAERVLYFVGPAGVLILPMLYYFARQLWRGPEFEQETPAMPRRWWQSLLMLIAAMALLGTALALFFDAPLSRLPAGMGGLFGLLGSMGIGAAAARLLPDAGWLPLAIGGVSLLAGAFITLRLFRINVRGRMSLPGLPEVKLPEVKLPGLAKQTADKPATGSQQSGAQQSGQSTPIAAPDATRPPPVISDPRLPAKPAALSAKSRQSGLFDSYTLPELALLTEPPTHTAPQLDKLALERNARLLEGVLEDFNVKGEIQAVRTGPVVTMYELEPAAGIKASRVIGLAEDVARNMSAMSARISAIPGRTVMGIELPNADRQTVALHELVASAEFAESKQVLPIILGKDIAGEPIIADLADMPHLLVAGTTGSGKSVGLNCILLSMLYRMTPDQLRLILIDPKVLELKTYDDIPHLLSPVVTEPAKAVRALKWAVEEMERRYRMMSDIGARNLAGFNERVSAAKAKGKPLGRRIATGFDRETGEELVEEQQLDFAELPLIVLIVDELADLMVTVGKEIEVLIQRLSQKSRAAGIHLIMATQRPSVDVITGVIKANLPTRISFHVTSRIDSRTILGEQGAEQLLGKGDMLYKPKTGALLRVHGPFVADEDVEKVADHWRTQGTPDYIESVTEEPSDGGFGFDDLDSASDSPDERKYRQACQIVFETQKASTSFVQRQMGVGYNSAAKWIERMEADGLVGPANHVGRRDIYRDRDGNPL